MDKIQYKAAVIEVVPIAPTDVIATSPAQVLDDREFDFERVPLH